MKLSEEGVDFITSWEGCRLKAYQCAAGVWTIGYGSTTYTDGTPVTEGDTIDSEGGARMLFLKNIVKYREVVESCVKVPLKQEQFDALVSLCYNIGVYAFTRSTLLKKLNGGDYAGACGEFAKWDNVGDQEHRGLENRRVAEIALFARSLNDG